jgi:hypothetical protein
MNTQTIWLASDFAAVNHSKMPWVVVQSHRPWYVSYQNKPPAVCTECKGVIEPIFLQYDVGLVLSGQVHAYQCNTPIYNYVADKRVEQTQVPVIYHEWCSGTLWWARYAAEAIHELHSTCQGQWSSLASLEPGLSYLMRTTGHG